MKKLTTSLFFLSTMALASFSASAASPTNCWKSAEVGGRLLIIESEKMSTAEEAFELMSKLYYSGFEELKVTKYNHYLLDATGKPTFDSDGGPVMRQYQAIYARIPTSKVKMYKNEQGLFNTALIKEKEQQLEDILTEYPQIISSGCIPVPGPGGRVGG